MVLVDTSVWIPYLRGDDLPPREVKSLEALLLAGEVVTCPVVLVELYRGARHDRERRQVNRLFEPLRVLDIGHPTWEMAYDLAFSLARRALTIPLPDLLIGCVTIEHRCALYHQDDLFDRMAEKSKLSIYTP